MLFGLILLISTLNLGSISAVPGMAGRVTPDATVAALSGTGTVLHGAAEAPAALPSQTPSGSTSAEQAKGEAKADESKAEDPTTPLVETWGEFSPGKGFVIGKSKLGSLSLSAYAMARYVNQMPAGQTFTDHLGNERPVDARNDFFSHRIMVFLTGWVASPKFYYNIFLWTVNTTAQQGIFATFGYQFSRRFSLYFGILGNPGSRSIGGSHPYWLAPDRVMADELFRNYFTMGISAQGELVPGLWWNATAGNNNSSLGIKATELDRKFTVGGSVWWMPTTKEFGPRGAYGDWEMHDTLATRFGVSVSHSPENRQTATPTTGTSNNTTIRLADSLNPFDTGTLAPGVTVESLDYDLLSVDAGIKYRGIFLQAEVYNRWLGNFKADGPLPLTQIHDWGFYVQAAFFPIPKKLELYAVTSQILADKAAGFSNSNEYILGGNYYPWNSRNYRINAQVISVNRSPVSSTFGYYVGGQKGTTASMAMSVFF
jgi:hypothetical protein